MLSILPIRNFYSRFERPISSLSLVLGFVFDILTLKRVDTLWENFWILGYLVIIGTAIILINRLEGERAITGESDRKHFWYINILQFSFGGVFSAFLILYFRSADIFTTWPFILLLASVFIGNESFKKHYVRLGLQSGLLFLSIYTFTIFLIPVLMHRIGTPVFLFSGFISLSIMYFFVELLMHFTKNRFRQKKKLIYAIVLGIYALINGLYFTNFIPPLPLSLKDAGAYHSIEKNTQGNYLVTKELKAWKDYFDLYPEFTKTPASTVYAYSAIFSLKNLNLNIFHEWQYYDMVKETWVTDSIINLNVIGGREGGFRTYSKRASLASGKWRVNVKTKDDKTIGVLRFTIVSSKSQPALVEELKK